MELIITEKVPTICLNMIVKNESHIIEKTLEMLCSGINFSYWVISDTGSTDNTCEIITNFFKKKNIPGELYNDEWKDFSHNRNLALNYAFGKSDLLFFFDADDEIHGTVNIPKSMDYDGYHFNFGHAGGISYHRLLLVNNKMRWKYVGVLHEVLVCVEPNPRLATIEGHYYVVSGRSGSRNKDPDKYMKDAIILENAYHEAKKNNDNIYCRYAFYCANSYKDAGKPEEAIKWYKITLGHDTWVQEKYVSCLYIYNEYIKLQDKGPGFYYLIESFKYDTERFECLFLLVQHYCVNNLSNVAYQLYEIVRDYYENRYLTQLLETKGSLNGKLFVDQAVGNFFLPFFMILVADRVKESKPEAKKTLYKMFEIVFTIKHVINDKQFIGNILFNVQFFIDLCISFNSNFVSLFQSYIDFLVECNIDLTNYDFMQKYEKYGIKINQSKLEQINKRIFSEEECKRSNKLLIYTGYAPYLWNYTYSLNNALGGSETAVCMLAKCLSSNFDVYVCGTLNEETFDNVHYINMDTLKKLTTTDAFNTVIVSRYVSFYELFQSLSYHKSYIWGHDTVLINYGCDIDTNRILSKWSNRINGCVCQTEWHKKLFLEHYPELTNKISVINNGISVEKFLNKNVKISNRFIYTSCAERGLDRIVELWPEILKELPDAELHVCSYNDFPKNDSEKILHGEMMKYDSIKHLGKLNKQQLYDLMSSAEYWLYPTGWPETSCITAMEMLMSEVICIYYPLAGLNDTLGDYGIRTKKDSEIEDIINLSIKNKNEIKRKGKEYAMTCSWENRSSLWKELICVKNKPKWYFYCQPGYNIKQIETYISNLNNIYTDYDILITNDINKIVNEHPSRATSVFRIFDNMVMNYLQKSEVGHLNTEPLNNPHRLNDILEIIKQYPNIQYYDYSKSNIKILNDHHVDTTSFIYLPYICSEDELTTLTNLNKNTEKTYDFGIISALHGDITHRRKIVIDSLVSQGFSVNCIDGWGSDRDSELAKCRIILNIHGFFNVTSLIFEHIRCDRLLYSGFEVLSENSLYLDEDFKNKFSNLRFISYDDFLNYDVIKRVVDNLKKNKVIDCFIFYNELELLNYRLNVLNDVVDYFIIVEATHTFTGKEKQLYFKENLERFDKFQNKIIHIIVEDFPYKNNINISNNEQWINENFHRNCIARGLQKIKLDDNDIITICDLDEIPDPNKLLQLKELNQDIGIKIIELDFYYYNLHCKRNEMWYHTKILSYNKYKELNTTCDNIRFMSCDVLNNFGWHLSYFGDSAFIKNKIQNFSHQEYNNDKFTNIEVLQKKIDTCSDLFDRDGNNQMTYVEIENNTYLPPLYDVYLKSFYKVKNYCFIHSCCLEPGNTFRLDHLIRRLMTSKCIEKLTKVFIINIGYPIDANYINNFELVSYEYKNKFEINNYSNNPNIQESATINKMIDFSKYNSSANILYIHTKGIRFHVNDTLQSDWINMMLYFLLDKHDECIQLLNKDYSSVGCNYCDSKMKHYSGNFWWAKCSHLKQLNYINENIRPRDYVEFCLFSIEHKHFSMHNSNINHYLENYPEIKYINNNNFSNSEVSSNNSSSKITIGFHSNQLCERGTEIALYDYAYYNKKLYNNRSIIFYNKNNPNNKTEVIKKFEDEFKCYAYNDFSEIDSIINQEHIDYFYNITGGERNDKQLVKNCPNLIHAVFNVDPYGEKYATISKQLSSKYNNIVDFVPHMINLPECNEDMRNQLNIPKNAFVMGRIGGFYQFDITLVHSAIKKILDIDSNMYFVFVNTNNFYNHPRIIYLSQIVNSIEKVKFINTCDAMIHARSDGETFGLAVGEFSSLNKPVITCYSKIDNSHIDILGDKAIIFDSEDSLIRIFMNIRNIISTKSDWNAYRDYTPEKVMKKFMDVFILNTNKITDTFNNKLNNNLSFEDKNIENMNIEYIDMNTQSPHFHNTKELVIVSAFLDIDRQNWSKYQRTVENYILSFSNYFNYSNKMVVFVDDKYIKEIQLLYNNSSHNNAIFIPINTEWMSKNIYAWQQLNISKSIMESENYKFLLKDRIVNGSPENIYPEYNTINHSKIDFICYAINNNLINSDSFICWSDFGYFHSILHNNPSNYPVASIDITKFKSDKLTFCLRNKIDNNDRNIIYTLVNAPEKFTGSFFAGPTNLMLKIQFLYHTSLKEMYDNNISDDDQHIYLRCFLKEPQLFNLYLDTCKWPEALCYFEKSSDRFELTKPLISNIKPLKYLFDEKKSTPLCEIMGRYGSDKGCLNIENSHHNYTTFYYSIFKDLREKQLRVFELGLGTNNIHIPSNMGAQGKPGASLFGWSEFFFNSKIFGADIDSNILFNTDKIKTFYCDQTNPEIIKKMWNEPDLQDNFDIIIEDGLHTFNANVCFFENSIYKLKQNGYFIIEDILEHEIYLFENKIKEWESQYKDCLFTLLKIPSSRNHSDNNLLVVVKTAV